MIRMRVMRLVLLSILLVCLYSAGLVTCVPGVPGAPWSHVELKKVKGYLRGLLENPGRAIRWIQKGYLRNKELINQALKDRFSRHWKLLRNDDLDAVLPTPAKVIRLTFHDCLKEPYTGHGCNGCLNFEGVDNIYHLDYCKHDRSYECSLLEGGLRPRSIRATDNNNLWFTALALEYLYKHEKLFHGETLYSTNKSRADLWAFAGLVAVEMTIRNQNKKCDDTKPAPCLLQVDQSSPNCSLIPELPAFRTGRTDCISDCDGDLPEFCTTEKEIHPDPHGDGNSVANFFKSHFGLNVQEAVALMGAHSLGRTHSKNSMFADAPWTPQGQNDWNNFYYINAVNKTGYVYVNPAPILEPGLDLLKCNLPVSAFIGDEDGRPLPVRFQIHAENKTEDGGPWNWQLFGGGMCDPSKCEEIMKSDGKFSINSCCHWMDYCKENPTKCPFVRKPVATAYNLFMNVNMLNVDMGFVFNFRGGGPPRYCNDLGRDFWYKRQEYSGVVECSLNTKSSGLGKDPAGNERTFFAEFDFYAKNPQRWVATFTKTYDKMLENGVNKDDLVPAPTSWFG